jgi:hypothetical protein
MQLVMPVHTSTTVVVNPVLQVTIVRVAAQANQVVQVGTIAHRVLLRKFIAQQASIAQAHLLSHRFAIFQPATIQLVVQHPVPTLQDNTT